MSFLKINDPVKKDLIVKEYFELKKNIWDNLLRERTGEQELQTDLSNYYRPITETQKATAREITEGLRFIKEGIENLPQAIKFPPIQPLGEASGQEKLFEKLLEPFEEASGASPENLGDIAYNYLHRKPKYFINDQTYRIYLGKDGYYHMGKQKDNEGNVKENKKKLTIADNNITVDDEKFRGTPGLWELIMKSNPSRLDYTDEDKDKYERLLIKANVLRRNFDPKETNPRSSVGRKWTRILSPIWKKYNEKKYEGEGFIVIPSDSYTLLERLDLLLASQKAGHTGVRNELVSICDGLKRQGVLDPKAYKKLNSVIKK